jgi:C_GCAxxG_C_C family probable redox protein
MSSKLYELQDIAEKKGPEYFIGPDRMVCLHSTMYAVNDALELVDDIDYIPPEVIKASSGLVAGLWTSEGTCGIVTAAGILISLKYGTPNPRDKEGRYVTGAKAREFYQWFKEMFGSCRCSDISLVDDWGNVKQGEWYNENLREHCGEILGKTTRKIVDVLTEDNPRVIRELRD